MSLISYKTLSHLNKNITVLGYPPFVFLFSFVFWFLLNIGAFFFLRAPIFSIIVVVLDILFILFSYLNYHRIKKRQLPLYTTFFIKKAQFITHDNDNIIELISKNGSDKY